MQFAEDSPLDWDNRWLNLISYTHPAVESGVLIMRVFVLTAFRERSDGVVMVADVAGGVVQLHVGGIQSERMRLDLLLIFISTSLSDHLNNTYQ